VCAHLMSSTGFRIGATITEVTKEDGLQSKAQKK
jgi:hypothetical protein